MPRDLTTKARLLQLLEELGQRFPHPATVYVCGGSSLLLKGAKTASLDVDLDFEVDPRHHSEWILLLRDLKERLNINIEEASPRHFLPLPSDWKTRVERIGRFDQLDVFHFDPVSVALSKLARFHAQDLEDVRHMLETGMVHRDILAQAFQEILPACEQFGLKLDPADLKRKWESFFGPK